MRWIPTTWLYRRCSICQQRLSRSTTLLYCDASRRQCRTALAVLCWAGLCRISAVASRPSAAACLLLMPQPSCVECHEDRSLDQYCSYSTLLLVCVESTATSTTTGSLESWHRLRHVNNLSPHLGISIRLRNVHADRPTCPGPRPAASPYYANCATTTSTSQAVLMSLVVSLVFSRLTMAARRSPVYLANSSTDYSL